MYKCLKIMVALGAIGKDLYRSVQREATQLGIEGTVQSVGSQDIKIYACGNKDSLDEFVELLYQLNIEGIEIEPFIKEKDYRGVFRILE